METKGRVFTLIVSCSVFFAVGMLGAGLGPVLPSISRNTGSALADTGALFTALFVGAIISQSVGGFLTDRFGQRRMLFVSLLTVSVGLAGVALSPTLPLALAAMLVAGLGNGVIIVAVNVAVSQLFHEKSLSALNVLNVFYGLGATAGPALVGLSLGIWDSGVPLLWAIVLVVLPALALTLRLNFGPEVVPTGESGGIAPPPPFRSPYLWALGVLLLLYVGLEVGTGGWLAVYVERTTPLTLQDATNMAAGFWLSLTGGRILGAILGTRFRPDLLLFAFLAISFSGGVLMVLGRGDTLVTLAAIILLGLGLGPTYPTVIALTTAHFRAAPGRATSVVVTLGSVGGSIMPWLQGVVLENTGTAATALYIAGGVFAMLLALTGARLLTPRPASTVPTAGRAQPQAGV
jgi:fucose permease